MESLSRCYVKMHFTHRIQFHYDLAKKNMLEMVGKWRGNCPKASIISIHSFPGLEPRGQTTERANRDAS